LFEPQSPGAPHGLSLAQVGAQAGAWQAPAEQISEPQSAFDPQGVPSLHVGSQPGG
jgi:hypothetical protein